MEFKDWEPIYEEILRDFGWSREKDEEAAKLLSSLLAGKTSIVSILKKKLEGKDVLVCGNALSLSGDLDRITAEKYVIIAADGATSTLLEKGIIPDIVVTDLDGYLPDEIEAGRKGALMVVHAHGDNMKKLEAVKDMKYVIGTTQAAPLANVHNFGGLSDGDRCVFLAHAFGARSIALAGFDLRDEKVTEMKKKKLKWAKKLIGMVPGVIDTRGT
ncbi:MAG: DUF115 domain-containing protein [Candidatus Methanoperedens sp.]|nr:DUF115 domain-containing protein [Candidatus Methanoperedens sp.]